MAIGEAKWSARITPEHYDRLAAARAMLSERGTNTSSTVLTSYSTAGFDENVRSKPDAIVIDTQRLYTGR